MARKKHRQRYEVFRSLLRESRMEAGIRQVDLARQLGVTQSFVSKSELGERRMDVVDLVDYLSAIQRSPTEFVDVLVRRLSDPAVRTRSRGTSGKTGPSRG